MSYARTEPGHEHAALLAGLLEGLALHVALHVVEPLGPDFDGPNQVVLARCDEHDVTLAVHPVDGDLGLALAMLEVGDEWPVAGVVAVGWTRTLDDDGAVGPRGGRVRSVVLVHRSGLSASVLHREGRVAEVMSEPVRGRIVDALRDLLARGAPGPRPGLGA